MSSPKTTTKLILSLLLLGQVAASDWDYHDPDEDWKVNYPLCGSGQKQSPINIDIGALTYPEAPLSLTVDYDASLGNWAGNVNNNGHSLQWTADDPENNSMNLRNVPGNDADSEFVLAQLHLHWGVNSSSGSEHTIAGSPAAAEVHFVHYDNAYNFSTAAKMPDGLTVLGVLVDEGAHNVYLEPIIAALRGDSDMLINESNGTDVSLNISGAIPAVSSRFYTYSGSLTTPGCYESVTWIVSAERMTMSAEQLGVLRGAYTHSTMEHKISPNFRPTQSLNGRNVTSSWVMPTTPPSVAPGSPTSSPTETAKASTSFVAFSACSAFVVVAIFLK